MTRSWQTFVNITIILLFGAAGGVLIALWFHS